MCNEGGMAPYSTIYSAFLDTHITQTPLPCDLYFIRALCLILEGVGGTAPCPA